MRTWDPGTRWPDARDAPTSSGPLSTATDRHMREGSVQRGERTGAGRPRELGCCGQRVPLQKGKDPLSTRTGPASPAERPSVQAASQGLSHSLNRVSHCCPPWQAQICPGVLDSHAPSFLSFSTGGETGTAAGRGESRAPHWSSAKLGCLDTS